MMFGGFLLGIFVLAKTLLKIDFPSGFCKRLRYFLY